MTNKNIQRGTENKVRFFHPVAGQNKKHSLAESLLNVAIGYGIALATQLAVFPLFGIHIPLHQNLAIGGIFTVVSVARSYALRRLFNYLHITGVLR